MGNKSLFDLDEGIENIPVVKAPTQVIKNVGTSALKHTKKQAAAITKAFVSQLYGSNTQGATDDSQTDTTVDPVAHAKAQQFSGNQGSSLYKSQQGTQAFSLKSGTTATKTPEEQQELSNVRKQLYTHKLNYIDKNNTLRKSSDLGDLDRELREKEQEREQLENKRKKEEEEEKEKKKQEEQNQKKQRFVPPAGKVRNKMRQPVAVTMAKTKTEINRGATG